MLNRSAVILTWLGQLFNPPPLDSMTPRQKIKRALFVSMSLVAGCLMVTTLGAAGIFLVQRGTDLLSNVPGWLNGLEIILASVSVNAFCVAVLLEISKADAKSVPLEKLSTSHH